MTSPEQTLPQEDQAREHVVLVPNKVAADLSKAAGGLVGVSVEHLPDEAKDKLVEDVENFDSEEHTAVQHAARMANLEETVDDHTLVKVSTDTPEAADRLTDNLIGVAIDPKQLGFKEDADPKAVFETSDNKARTKSHMYHELATNLEDGLSSGYERTPEEKEMLENRLEDYKAKHAEAVSDNKMHDGIYQTMEVVNRDRDGE